MSGKLYIIATPIGNLSDITIRALEKLKNIDIIACEDTRITKKLLNKYNITKPLLRYDEHTHSYSYQKIIETLQSGKDVALVSDAGTPGLSDPGKKLIDEVLKHDITLIPIPGPSAITAIIQIAGDIGSDIISFIGFLPNKKNERTNLLNELLDRGSAFIFFLPPRRILTLLKELDEISPERELIIGRELTKFHEEVIRGKPGKIIDILKDKVTKGEFVILVKGSKRPKKSDVNIPMISKLLEIVMKAGIKKRDACKLISEITGSPTNLIYKISRDYH
ncbi:MAG: 16S rRNA (cytidine(1402)-2'-O)-methyltransferase [bacterium]